MTYSKIIQSINNNNLVQTEQAKPNQVENNAGGFVFQITIWSQLDRFLILGSESGTYYVSSKKHTINNLSVIDKCLNED